MFEDADANASARIILLPVETVADILIIEDGPSINEVGSVALSLNQLDPNGNYIAEERSIEIMVPI